MTYWTRAVAFFTHSQLFFIKVTVLQLLVVDVSSLVRTPLRHLDLNKKHRQLGRTLKKTTNTNQNNTKLRKRNNEQWSKAS